MAHQQNFTVYPLDIVARQKTMDNPPVVFTGGLLVVLQHLKYRHVKTCLIFVYFLGNGRGKRKDSSAKVTYVALTCLYE